MSLLTTVVKLLQGLGRSFSAESNDDEGDSMEEDTSVRRRTGSDGLAIKPFTLPEFKCNVPAYILEKKDTAPHERYMLESQSIIAQKVDFLIEHLSDLTDQVRRQEAYQIQFFKWKARFTRRVTLLIFLLISFFSYIAPYLHPLERMPSPTPSHIVKTNIVSNP